MIAHDSPLRPLTDDGETPYDLAVKHKGNECIEKLGKNIHARGLFNGIFVANTRVKPPVSRRSNYYHGSLTNTVSAIEGRFSLFDFCLLANASNIELFQKT